MNSTTSNTTTFTGFRPHPGQKKVLQGFARSSHKFCTVSTGRQYGKTIMGINLLLFWTLNNSNAKGAWVAPVYAQSRKVFETISQVCKAAIVGSNKAELSIKFVNGSSIKFLSSERHDSIRGYSFHYMVLDEAAYIQKVAVNQAILPTLTAIGKKCLMISTPASKSNWLYEYYLKGQEENDTYISFNGYSLDNPYADQEFILEQKKSLPLQIFEQEYEGMFTDSGAEVFKNISQVSVLNAWEDKGKDLYYGIDTGLQDDYSVLTIIDTFGKVHYIDRINNMPLQSIADRFISTIKKYKCISGYVETNGIGRGMYDALKGKVKVKEFNTSNESKTQIIRRLIGDIEEMTIELPSKELFRPLYNELNAYSYKVKPDGKITFAGKGDHDDTVMSLAIANWARHNIVSTARAFHVGGSGGKVPKGNTTFNINF